MKLSLLMNDNTLVCLWILVFPIGIIEVWTSRKCCFWHYFSSLKDYWAPSTWNSLVYTSWGEMERYEEGVFSSSKCEKRKLAETQKPIGIIEVSTSCKCCVSIYFSSLHDYWPPSIWKSLVHTSLCRMERC